MTQQPTTNGKVPPQTSPKFYDKIEAFIQCEFYKNGLNDWFRENFPLVYDNIERTIIPKRKEQLQLYYEVEEIELEIERLDSEIAEAAIDSSEKRSKLSEQEVSSDATKQSDLFWKQANKAWHYFLKAGLAIITVLSLFGIFGITNLKNPLGTQGLWSPMLGIIIFASVSLVWLTSHTILNRVKTTDNNKIIIAWAVMIWVSEMLIGLTTVPMLLILHKAAAAARGVQIKAELEWWEWLGTALGVTVFTLINILSAIAEAEAQKLKEKQAQEMRPFIAEYKKAQETHNQLQRIQNNKWAQTRLKNEKIRELEKIIFLFYDQQQIKDWLVALSNSVTIGDIHHGKYPVRQDSQDKPQSFQGKDSISLNGKYTPTSISNFSALSSQTSSTNFTGDSKNE
jgi:hypothetical protein